MFVAGVVVVVALALAIDYGARHDRHRFEQQIVFELDEKDPIGIELREQSCVAKLRLHPRVLRVQKEINPTLFGNFGIVLSRVAKQ
jgi:hypothetical protein